MKGDSTSQRAESKGAAFKGAALLLLAGILVVQVMTLGAVRETSVTWADIRGQENPVAANRVPVVRVLGTVDVDGSVEVANAVEVEGTVDVGNTVSVYVTEQ